MSDEGNKGQPGIIARLASKNRGLRDANKALSAELDELKKSSAVALQQLDQLKGQSDPQGLATKVKELQGEIRTRDHRAVFNRLAKAAGVRDDGLDDLFSLSGYRAEADVPDEASITTLIEEQKGKRGYLFAPPAKEGDGKTAEPPKPGAGSGKGGTSTQGAPVISEDLLKSDPIYVMKNYDRVVEAAKAKVAAGGP